MNTNKVVLFKNKDGSVDLAVSDDGTILIDDREYSVSYINEDFFLLDLKCYSHKQFNETFIETGHSIVGGKGVLNR